MKNEKQTLGEYFQEARKEKGVSMDEIVRDTNIPKRYLESIESDNFDVFPGATYAMGFITNYADALEVDRDVALSMYKRQMKIEQDSPIEQLVGKKKQLPIDNNVLAIGGIIASAIIVVILISLAIRGGSKGSNLPPQNYTFSYDEIGSIVNKKFRIGDSLSVTGNLSNQPPINIQFESIGPSRSLNMKINNNPYSVKSGELLSIDSDMNGTNELGIEVFTAREKEIKLSVTLLKELAQSLSNSVELDNIYNKFKEYILSESEFLTAPARSEVDLKVSSSGYGFLSYSADGKEEKEMALNNGSVIHINFESHAIIHLGNSGAVKISAGSKEEAGGGWGETTKSIFYWKNKNGQFALMRANLK